MPEAVALRYFLVCVDDQDSHRTRMIHEYTNVQPPFNNVVQFAQNDDDGRVSFSTLF
jgi:hypothetical protein